MHTRSGESGNDEAVVVELGDKGAHVVWPRAIEMFEALDPNGYRKVPDPLILRSSGGWLTLQAGVEHGTSASTLGHFEQRLRYFRAISTGARAVDYSSINGMSSTVDGLATWTGRTPVTQQILLDPSKQHVNELSITAKNLDPLPLGGPLDLKLTTSYTQCSRYGRRLPDIDYAGRAYQESGVGRLERPRSSTQDDPGPDVSCVWPASSFPHWQCHARGRPGNRAQRRAQVLARGL